MMGEIDLVFGKSVCLVKDIGLNRSSKEEAQYHGLVLV